jgi:hypothetical protein
MAFNYFNKLFKHAISGVDAASKYMDEKMTPFCDSVVEALAGMTIKSNDERVRTILQEKFQIFFENNTIRISKPKLEVNKRGRNGYNVFVEENRQRLAEEHNIEPNQAGFIELGRICGREWKQLDEAAQNEYKQRALQLNEASKLAPAPVETKNKDEHNCEYNGCIKKCKTEPIDGSYFCSQHKRKVNKKEEKKETKKEEKKETKKEEKKETKKEEKKETKKEEKKETKKEEKKETKKETKKVLIEDEEKTQPTSKYDVKFNFDIEPVRRIDDFDYWDSAKKVKGTNYYMHPENFIVYDPTTDTDFYIFIGIAVGTKLYKYQTEKDFPSNIIEWVSDCGFKVDLKPVLIADSDELDE